MRDHGINFRLIVDGFSPATPTSQTMVDMLASLATYERELIVEQVNTRIAAAGLSGTRFRRPRSDPPVSAEELSIVNSACAKGPTRLGNPINRARPPDSRHQWGTITDDIIEAAASMSVIDD